MNKLTNFISEVAVTVHKGSQEELPRAQGQGQRPRGATPRLRSGPWTAAYQGPLSMGFSRQEYWSGFPFPSPGDKKFLDHYQKSVENTIRSIKIQLPLFFLPLPST